MLNAPPHSHYPLPLVRRIQPVVLVRGPIEQPIKNSDIDGYLRWFAEILAMCVAAAVVTIVNTTDSIVVCVRVVNLVVIILSVPCT